MAQKAKAFEIEMQMDDGRWDEIASPFVIKSTAEAVHWIRDHGEAGETYRVVQLCTAPMTVMEESYPARSLKPADD